MIGFILRHNTGITYIVIVVILVSTVAAQVPTPKHPSLLGAMFAQLRQVGRDTLAVTLGRIMEDHEEPPAEPAPEAPHPDAAAR